MNKYQVGDIVGYFSEGIDSWVIVGVGEVYYNLVWRDMPPRQYTINSIDDNLILLTDIFRGAW